MRHYEIGSNLWRMSALRINIDWKGNNELFRPFGGLMKSKISCWGRAHYQPLIGGSVAASVLLLVGARALAVGFETESGEFYGSWDTTVSYGQGWRLESRDQRLIATANGGVGRSPNIDDGNLNFDTGITTQAWKVISEIELNYKSFGGFIRGRALYDFELEGGRTARTPLSQAALDRVGSRAEVLDAFLWGRFDAGSVPIELRVGEQVLSWGESTFIQNSINVINHIDVGAIRVPGAELREALLPQGMAWLSLGTSENTTLEAFYQYDWDDTKPEPVGSFFSSNDFVPEGGEVVVLGFGQWSDQGTDFRPLGGDFLPNFNHVARDPIVNADDAGQFGAAFRWFVPKLGAGTELGFYFINYHSRLPLISARTGTQAGLGNGTGAAFAVGGAAQGLAAGLSFDTAVALAAQNAVAAAASFGGNYDLASATAAATVGANTALAGGDVAGLASSFGVDQFGQTAAYFTEFPEDINLLGLSFNTSIGTTGIAWQGDLAYRQDVPLQLDDVEVLFAALSPFEAAVGDGAFAAFGQLGAFGLNDQVRGWVLRDTYQFQTTFTKVFGPLLGASQGALVWEGAVTVIDDFPDKLTGGPNGQGLRFNGPGTSVSGNPALVDAHFGEIEPQDRFPDETSWGYRLAGRLDYFNLIGPWTVAPRFSWQHDVSGTTPGPGGNFVEDRTALTLGVRGTYQNAWEVDLSYTTFSGAGRYNLLNDRDFFAFNVKASF